MDYRDFNIDIRTTKNAGEVQTTCPQCSHTRKKKNDKCLSVNLDKKTWFCHHCAWSGGLNTRTEEVIYTKPDWKNKTELSENIVKWFEDQRKISQKTLNAMKISEGVEWMPQKNKEVNTVQFNYFRNGELINVKYRDGGKGFKMHKNAELIFYNLDSIINQKEVIICEGEIDCLSFIEAGITSVVSVPNGANLNTNNLQYLDNCINLFDSVETIYIATDNDIAGRKLRIELAERFGFERCKYIEFEEYKDANDLLIHKGPRVLVDCYNNAFSFPLEGVFTISDMDNEIYDMYMNGLDSGLKTGMAEFDDLISFVKGYITVITGIPGHGKSDFVDQICLLLNIRHKSSIAYYSPENKPTRLHFSKLARKLVGKNWFGQNRMSFTEVEQVKKFLDNKVFFIKPEKDFSLKTILSSVKQLKKQKGIDFFVIDAWNKLEHKYTSNETKYIGESLDELSMFCEENNVHCFLVAHPRKMTKKPDGTYDIPTLYDIAGSANFFNKADNGITVYRNFSLHITEIYVQKVKFSHWGKPGSCNFVYEINSGRYTDPADDSCYNWITNQEQKEHRELSEGPPPLPTPTANEAFGEPRLPYKDKDDMYDFNPNDEIPF